MIGKATMGAGGIPKRKGTQGANFYIFLICLAAIGGALVSVYAVVIVLFGLLPAMIAMIVDQDARKYISKIVFLYNIMGIIPFVYKIYRSSSSNNAAIEIIIDPSTWMMIFAAAGLGWIIYWAVPQFAVLLRNFVINVQIAKLESELASLTEEWGDEVKAQTRRGQ